MSPSHFQGTDVAYMIFAQMTLYLCDHQYHYALASAAQEVGCNTALEKEIFFPLCVLHKKKLTASKRHLSSESTGRSSLYISKLHASTKQSLLMKKPQANQLPSSLPLEGLAIRKEATFRGYNMRKYSGGRRKSSLQKYITGISSIAINCKKERKLNP